MIIRRFFARSREIIRKPLMMILGGLALLSMVAAGSWFLVFNTPDDPPSLVPITVIAGPGDYYSAVWFTESLLILQTDTDSSDQEFESGLIRMNISGADERLLDIPYPTDCSRLDFFTPSRLPDARLAFQVHCIYQNASGNWGSKREWLTFDMQTGATESLLNYDLPMIGTGGLNQVWNPEMTQGIVNWGARLLEEHLYWITADDYQLLDLDFPHIVGAGWSPDGRYISFVAAERRGTVAANPPATLYIMDSDATDIRVLVPGPLYTSGGSWSPDSHWYVFSANIEAEAGQPYGSGLWLVEVSTGQRYLVIPGQSFVVPSWSPDGQQLASIRVSREELFGHNEVVIIDLGPFFASLTSGD